MTVILNKDFIKSQEKAIRPAIKVLINKLENYKLAPFINLIKSTLKEESNISELVGELRYTFVKTFKLAVNKSSYQEETALISIITQLVRNIDCVKVVKAVEKRDGKFITFYRIHPINFDAHSRIRVSNVNENFESKQSIKYKGHCLTQRDVTEGVWDDQLNSETTFRAKYFDKRLFELHAFLIYIKDVSGIKHSKLQYKAYLESEAQLGYNLSNSEFKICKFWDTRGRGYANSTFGTFKPLGNHFESRLVELTESYTVTEEDIKYAKWLLWTDLNGRMPMEEALEKYSAFTVIKKVNSNLTKITNSYNSMHEYKTLKRGETVNVITPNELGDMLYFNEIAKLIREGEGKESNLLLEVDMTNSGLIHFANALRKPKLLTLANLLDPTKVHDSHKSVVEAVNKPDFIRDDAKPVNTALLHGGSVKVMANNLGMELPTVIDFLIHSYGEEYSIPNEIAKLGKQINANEESFIEWTMPDGFKSVGVAYTTNTKVRVTSLINGRKVKSMITCIMPTVAVAGQLLTGHCDKVKVNGLYAHLIHSIDGWFMRETYRRCGFTFTDVLDKWKLRPSDIKELFEVQYILLEESKDLLQDLLNQITTRYEVKAIKLPVGDSEVVFTQNWLAA